MKQKKEKTKAVAEPINMEADAGKGLEGADKDSYAVPFLQVLQGLSPQIDTVDGAKPGLFINTITNEMFESVLVVPCAYKRAFIRWASRDDGGGFKGAYTPLEVESGDIEGMERDDFGQFVVGTDVLKDTRNHYVLVKSGSGMWQPAVLSLYSTQVKKSKRWMALIQGIELPAKKEGAPGFNPPSFSHVYKLITVKEKNDKGSWHGIEIELAYKVTEVHLYHKAKEFCEQVNAGIVQTAEPIEDNGKF